MFYQPDDDLLPKIGVIAAYDFVSAGFLILSSSAEPSHRTLGLTALILFGGLAVVATKDSAPRMLSDGAAFAARKFFKRPAAHNDGPR